MPYYRPGGWVLYCPNGRRPDRASLGHSRRFVGRILRRQQREGVRVGTDTPLSPLLTIQWYFERPDGEGHWLEHVSTYVASSRHLLPWPHPMPPGLPPAPDADMADIDAHVRPTQVFW